jgi:hypothetical protein
MAAFLETLSAGDLGIFVNNEDFIAIQSMRERYSQEVNYRSAFGANHPTIRSKRAADANTVSFSFLLLKSGVTRGLNSYVVLRQMDDFEIQTKKGALIETYTGCNWTDIDIDTGMDGVTVSVDVTVPGFLNDAS